MTRITLGIILLSATAIITSAPAQAQNGTLTRSFVSSAGLDGNPCTITQPCATFAHAYTKLSANGIIAALDPGKYGPITITTGVAINGNGWAAITGPAPGNAITVNAGSGDVTLIGLEIDGANTATDGIVFVGGKSLIVSNCTIRQFTSHGMLLNAASPVTLTDLVIASNSQYGVLAAPVGVGGTLTFDHVRFIGNNDAMSFQDGN